MSAAACRPSIDALCGLGHATNWAVTFCTAMRVTIHRVGLLDLSSSTDRTYPVSVDPISVNRAFCPRYWAIRARLASTGSVVSNFCIRLTVPDSRTVGYQ